MKKLLLFGLLLSGLASCKKDGSDPTPAPSAAATLVGTWSLDQDNTLITPVSGGTPRHLPNITVPGTVLSTYTADGKCISTNTNVTPASIETNKYTYSGSTITYINASGVITSTSQVTVLTATDLTLVSTRQDSNNMYVRTSTFKRQ
jgi:hypothetical protein